MINIAIIGRPNVGKSTLFNALIKKRIAITHETAGVTRDMLKYEYQRQEKKICLIDLGGLLGESNYSKEITDKGMEQMESANIILFVVSVEEILSEDYEILALLRKVSEKVILVVNKVDNEKRVWNAHEFYTLGIHDIVHISAVHRKNIDELWEHIDKKSTNFIEEIEDVSTITPEPSSMDTPNAITNLLIVGKPNSGKSSFFNYMLKRPQNLVSDIPGTTRDSTTELLQYKTKQYRIIDTAGLRRKAKIYDTVEYFSSQRAIENINRADIVLLLIDVLEGMSEQDKKIASLALSRRKSMIICLNKWDMIREKEAMKRLQKERIQFLVPQLSFSPLCMISAKTGKGIDDIFKTINTMERQLETRVATSHINKILQLALQKNPPPIIKNRRGKLRFAAQSGVKPVSFELHVNKKSLFSESYVQYLVKIVRKEYKLDYIPVFLTLSEKQ